MTYTPAKKSDLTFEDYDSLQIETIIQQIRDGFALFTVNNVLPHQKHLEKPFRLIEPNEESMIHLALGANPIFYLKDESGELFYLVNNGRVYELNQLKAGY